MTDNLKNAVDRPSSNGGEFRRGPVGIVCILVLPAFLWTIAGCGSLKRAMLNSALDTMAGGEASRVYSSDDDPELVRDALPFGLKTYETLLAGDPANRDLHLVLAEGFVSYSAAFIDGRADLLVYEDLGKSRSLRARARKLYLRGRDYALDGLELKFPGFRDALLADPSEALRDMSPEDVPFLYWAGAGWAGAISGSAGKMSMVAEMPMAEALARKALELEEGYGQGALHEFFILWEGGRSEAMGGSSRRAIEHFESALLLSGGRKASPYVALAETVAVNRQDHLFFSELLKKALELDTDGAPEHRLQNILAQEKARWLLENAGELFFDLEDDRP